MTNTRPCMCQAMKLAIRMVFESASLGLSLKIEKCSFFPRHAIKALGTIVNLSTFEFSVSASRVTKIRSTMHKLSSAASSNPKAVPAKLVASFIGLIWSIATCCHRAASVMVRSITDTLSQGLRSNMNIYDMPLSRIVNRFWAGSVRWSKEAAQQLEFWSHVRFEELRAPISADVLGLTVEQTFWYPGDFDPARVSFLFQDASAFASGGGIMRMINGLITPGDRLFLAQFSEEQRRLSSTLRELLGILWCLVSTAAHTRPRVVFICDNWQSCRAILRGSRVPEIQAVAERIFLWCLRNNKVCWPVWVPRTHRLIQEADRRSRMFIPHDNRSPGLIVAMANKMSQRLWCRDLSFDQAASHLSAVWVRGHQLPFNSVCFQPGAAGVDMFRCISSWRGQINYVFPPRPILGRLFTFLPTTRAKAIVVVQLPVPNAWWSFAVVPGAVGLVDRCEQAGFALFAYNFEDA